MNMINEGVQELGRTVMNTPKRLLVYVRQQLTHIAISIFRRHLRPVLKVVAAIGRFYISVIFV